MDKIKIITDSCLDIPKELIREKDIEVLPVMINFGEESYYDGVDIDVEKMQERIDREGQLPTTAQITPMRYEECMKKYLDEGYKVIVITMSSKMSGTYQSAVLAKNMLDTDDVIVIDANTITGAQGLIVLKACQLRDKGLSIKEIEAGVLDMIPKIKSAISFESLDNLVKGGRISKAAGTIGAMLGLRIILDIQDGAMAVTDKVRGGKKALKKLLTNFESVELDQEMPVILMSFKNEDLYPAIKTYLEDKNITYIDQKVGCAVGIHSGPKVVAIFFVEK